MEQFQRKLLIFSVLIFLSFTSFLPSACAGNGIDDQITRFSAMEEHDKALLFLENLLHSQNLTVEQKVDILMAQGIKYLSLVKFSQAKDAYSKAEVLARANNLKAQQQKIHKMLGIVYYYQGSYPEALNEYKTSLIFYDDDGSSLNRANLLNNMALVYVSMGLTSLALTTYQAADDLYQLYGDEVDKTDIRYNIAGLYLRLRRYDIAIKMFLELIDTFEELNELKSVAMASADLGISYKDSGQYKQAEQYMLSALSYFEQHDKKYDIASQMHNLSELYNDIGELDKAKDYAEKGIKLSLEIAHNKAYAGSLQSLAKILFSQGDLEGALKNILLANKVAEKMGYNELLTGNLAIQSLIYATQQKTAEALVLINNYEKQRHQAANDKLNVQLAQFESAQLNFQLEQLKQSRVLQQLKATKETQKRNFILVAILSVLLVSFLIYRRKVENSGKRQLEIKVKQRTKALEISTKKLQEAGNVKNQFIANMSHEIRTPLTAVIGQAEAILYGEVPPEHITQEVGVILGNSLHLLELINEVLDLSKIEANKFELELAPQDLHKILFELGNMFTEQARSKGLSFNIIHELNTPFIVNVDGLRLKQILINLCSNAIKFTEDGLVTFEIKYQNNALVFKISDTGIGMTPSQLEQVFDNFTQADSSISRRFGGSGLGVFLSRELAKVMGGTISVASEIHHGSVFTFVLPIEEATSVIDQELAQKYERELQHKKERHKRLSTIQKPIYSTASAETIVEQPMYSGKILLVDDHDDNRRLIARLLAHFGLDVYTAKNGKEALSLYSSKKPELILMDIQMPEMDGIEALKKLQTLGCNCPIYALTANAMSHEIAKYLALGFTGHLKKPLERERFMLIIEKYFPLKENLKNQSEHLVDNTTLSNKNEQTVIENNSIDQASLNDEGTITTEKPTFGLGKALDDVDISDLVIKFVANLSRDKVMILTHFDNNDFDMLQQVTHHISGAAQMFGFNELSQLCINLVQAIKTDDFELAKQLTLNVIDEISSIQKH